MSSLPVPPCGCGDDPVAALVTLFVDVFQGKQIAAGAQPARRPVFRRTHGVAHGRFEIVPGLPDDLRLGVFARQPSYPVWVRFSSDVQDGVPDRRGTVGIGVKLFDDGGGTHDFVLQNHDVFFVDTARDMCEFTCLTLNGRGDEYFAAHPVTKQILDDMEKDVDSVLATTLWSVLPSKLGAQLHVKYKLAPASMPPPRWAPDKDDPFFLRDDLQGRLRSGEARWNFYVQRALDETRTPLDRATVRWSEQDSEPVHVATLIVPQQDIEARGQAAYGENLSFTPWHALPEHQPVGSIADARRAVYAASAAARRNTNGVPLGEPDAPRPPELRPGEAYPAIADDQIVRAAIHPAIGIARVGDSDEIYLGPEIPEPPRPAPGARHDASGRLKRQAARFRIYGYDAAGKLVRELTADRATISWTVHVANSKAAWFQWKNMPLDIPEASKLVAKRRNAAVTGEARKELVIDAGGGRAISGPSIPGDDNACTGRFLGRDVYLGEMRTDDRGRLLFVPGRGVSASPAGLPPLDPADPDTFANATGWFDDVCDGPVTASVDIDGRFIPVDSAWVVSAPPDYAPGVIGVRTLYDLLHDVYVRGGLSKPVGGTVSFARDIKPILMRLVDLQWVNKGYALEFGKGAPHDFSDLEYLERLATPPRAPDDDPWVSLRRSVFHLFRDPAVLDDATGDEPALRWPWIYGDASLEPAPSPRAYAAVTGEQHRKLKAWALGQFVRGSEPPRYRSIAAVPLEAQPATLDRAALHHCLADAFHPGCELTWPMRHLSMWRAPFRVRTRVRGEARPEYGDTLDAAGALATGGPLHAQGPGDLTRWMAVPWQVDTTGCQSGYEADYDPYIPSFWPARVPNHVLGEQDYRAVIDETRPRAERIAAFNRREHWVRRLGPRFRDQVAAMITRFGDQALIELRPGVEGDRELPALIGVGTPARAGLEAMGVSEEPPEEIDAERAAHLELDALRQTPHERAVHNAGWDSVEDYEDARRLLGFSPRK